MDQHTPSYKSAKKYFGDAASEYENIRTKQPHWQIEQEIVGAYVKGLPKGAEIADIPFGTGRFVPFYMERSLKVWGLDISPDMIAVAKEKFEGIEGINIAIAPAEEIPLPDQSIDYLICHRFIKWLPNLAAVNVVMAEFSRITRKQMFVQVRLKAETQKEKQKKKVSLLSKIWLRFFGGKKTKKRRPDGEAITFKIPENEFVEIVRSKGFQVSSIERREDIGEGVAYFTITKL